MKNEAQKFDPVARKLGIGASEAAAALGLSRYRSPLDVYVDKTKDTPHVWFDTPATKRGKRAESYVLDSYEDDVAKLSARNPKTITSEKHPFMFASLDAVRASDGRPVEAKTAGQFAAHEWGESGTDEIPQEYLIQVMHQMIVSCKPVGDLAAAIKSFDDMRYFEIQNDQELSEMIIEGLLNFWKRVENREPPAPVTGEQAEKLYRKSIAEAVEADDETKAIWAQLIETRAALKPLEKQEEKLIGDIKIYMAEKDTLLINAVPVCTWKASGEVTRLDAKRLQRELPEIYANYLTKSDGSRRFLIKGAKENE